MATEGTMLHESRFRLFRSVRPGLRQCVSKKAYVSLKLLSSSGHLAVPHNRWEPQNLPWRKQDAQLPPDGRLSTRSCVFGQQFDSAHGPGHSSWAETSR